MQRKRFWDGRTVHVAQTDPQRDKRCVEIGLTPETGRELALALRRLQQTSLANAPAVDELVNALDYVLVGDPFSRRQHAEMEAAKEKELSVPGSGAGGFEPKPGDLRTLNNGQMQEFGEGRWHNVKPPPYPDSPSDADFARDAKPGHSYWPSENPTWEGFRCGWSETAVGPLCGKTKEEHP